MATFSWMIKAILFVSVEKLGKKTPLLIRAIIMTNGGGGDGPLNCFETKTDHSFFLIDIDFGFVLSNSPGSMGFEKSPFKLSQEYIDVLGGVDSELFGQYRCLMKQAFKALRKYGDTILLLVEMMSKTSNLPCFKNNPDHVLLQLKERFQFHLTDRQLDLFVDKLISNSRGNLFTRLYDTYQYYSQVG